MEKNGTKNEEPKYSQDLLEVLSDFLYPFQALFEQLEESDETQGIARIGFALIRDQEEGMEKLVEAIEKDLGKIKVHTPLGWHAKFHPRYLGVTMESKEKG